MGQLSWDSADIKRVEAVNVFLSRGVEPVFGYPRERPSRSCADFGAVCVKEALCNPIQAEMWGVFVESRKLELLLS